MRLEVHCGATRTVILAGRWAFKLPGRWSFRRCGPFNRWFWRARYRMLLEGLLGNMQEADFATTGWMGLCPVRLALPGGWLVVMPRCQHVTLEEFEAVDFDELVTPGGWYARENLKIWGGQACRSEEPETGVIPVERKPSSFGWYEDGHGRRIVAIDYG